MATVQAAPKTTAVGRFIVIFGTKGGVGKTLVATNLAVSLAERFKKSVCLVDLDIMAVGDLARLLNVTVNRSMVNLVPAFSRPSETALVALDGALIPHASGVRLLAATANPRQMHQLDMAILPKVFAALTQRFEYVIVDGGRTFSDALVSAFDASHLILLVASPDLLSLYQTKWTLGIVESLHFPSSMVKVVLNRAESRGGVGKQDVRVAIPCDVVGELPSDGATAGTALNQGTPIVTAFAQTKITAAFHKLAETLIQQPTLYTMHHDVSRKRQADGAGDGVVDVGTMWSSRLYAGGEQVGEAEEATDEIILMKRRIHEKLVQELDLKKLDLGSMADATRLLELRQKSERVIANLLAKEMGGLISSPEVRARMVKEIADEALGLGPLEELLADAAVSDILVNNKDQVYVERKGKLELTNKKFMSNDQLRAIIERIIAPLGRRIDESSPMVDARLPDGSRVNAVIPPLAIKGPTLSIRKFSRARYTGEDLLAFGSVDARMLELVRACVLARKNMIISGGTGSGKTTFLNIVSSYIPDGERIITLEDAAELRLNQTHWVSLETRPPSVEGKGQITIRDLFRNTLRMRPDRIIIGECRGGEALDMLQAMNTGHDGSITTIHANSPRDVVGRLDSMVLMSNLELPVRAIRDMIASAVHVIVQIARLSDGSRKVISVCELTGIEQGDIQMQDIFVFKQTGLAPDGTVLGYFTGTGRVPTFLDELRVKGITFDGSFFALTPPDHQEPPRVHAGS